MTALKYNFWVLASQNFWVNNRKENNEIKIKQLDVNQYLDFMKAKYYTLADRNDHCIKQTTQKQL